MSGKTPAIIPRTGKTEHTPAWQVELAQAVRSGNELLHLLDIQPDQLNIRPLTGDFPLRVPRGFVRRMSRGDPHDPLLLQVLPVHEETETRGGFHADPLREADAMPVRSSTISPHMPRFTNSF